MSTYRLDKLFSPRSVAVVGASPRETSPGVDLILAVLSCASSGRRQERVWRARAKIDTIATSAGGRDRTPQYLNGGNARKSGAIRQRPGNVERSACPGRSRKIRYLGRRSNIFVHVWCAHFIGRVLADALLASVHSAVAVNSWRLASGSSRARVSVASSSRSSSQPRNWVPRPIRWSARDRGGEQQSIWGIGGVGPFRCPLWALCSTALTETTKSLSQSTLSWPDTTPVLQGSHRAEKRGARGDLCDGSPAPLLLGFPLHRRASSVVGRTSGGLGSVTKSRPPQVTNGDKNWPLGGR
jgi:hypothetical protein